MEVTLQQILDVRERRVTRQQTLLARYRKPLICFTMNIPGPEKNNPLITRGFHLGMELLSAQLTGSRIPVLYGDVYEEDTGCEAYLAADAEPENLKKLCVQIEDGLPVGRLFDMDVLRPDGSKVSRENLDLPGRTCMICGAPVYLCSRSRSHSLSQLRQKTDSLLCDALRQQDARRIGTLAAKSLLHEVCVTPKPGLVDRQNTGSHKDMDIFTFMSSSAALQPYFTDCARIGMETADLSPAETFEKTRFRGKLAEQEMFAATGGVNTHKGAIFSLGILCAAAGRLNEENPAPQAICAQAAAMTAGISARDMAQGSCTTTGEKLYKEHGITGARGQAEAGFPAVLEVGLPVLREGLSRGLSVNDAGAATLLHLLAASHDTNMIGRSDLKTHDSVRERIAALLKEDPYPSREVLETLDDDFISHNLSPGGSADLLAATYFLYYLKKDL